MNNPLRSLAEIYRLNDQIIGQITSGFTATDWLHRAGQASHALWIIGHMTTYRKETLPPENLPLRQKLLRQLRPR